jgi:hypothetical protein
MCVSTGNKWADLAIVIVASVVTYGAATGWFAAAGTGAAAAGGGGAALGWWWSNMVLGLPLQDLGLEPLGLVHYRSRYSRCWSKCRSHHS